MDLVAAGLLLCLDCGRRLYQCRSVIVFQRQASERLAVQLPGQTRLLACSELRKAPCSQSPSVSAAVG
jgi:hypothetical protein